MKIAIIGLGSIGSVHANVLSLLNTPAAALCDLLPHRSERIREKYAPNAAIYTDWREMLSDFRPDVVHICTPHDLHAEMIIEALGQNIHVLCEKPLCIHMSELSQILAAEEKSAAMLGVCHQNRYNTVNQFLKQYLSEHPVKGAYGSVVWGRNAKYYASSPWRGELERAGGGTLINQALHTLDLLAWLCGEPEALTAMHDNLTMRQITNVEDTIAIHCFGKINYSFFATVCASFDFPVELSFELENGDHLLALQKTVLLNGEVIAADEVKRSFGKSCYGDGHIRLVEDFYRCLSEQKPFPINGREAAKVMRMIIGAYKSCGERVMLNEQS